MTRELDICDRTFIEVVQIPIRLKFVLLPGCPAAA